VGFCGYVSGLLNGDFVSEILSPTMLLKVEKFMKPLHFILSQIVFLVKLNKIYFFIHIILICSKQHSYHSIYIHFILFHFVSNDANEGGEMAGLDAVKVITST
jgi:hypothetical protein